MHKEFKRNICFSFFEDYRETAKKIEEDFGKEAVTDYYNVIIDYALYEFEPELKGVLKYVWYTTKTTIDKSVERRSNGFGKEDTEKTNRILEYRKDNPQATQREIAEATGTSTGKVNKVLNSFYADTNIDTSSLSFTYTNTPSYSFSNTTREHDAKMKKEDDSAIMQKPVKKKRRLCDLDDWDLESLEDALRTGTRYADLYKRYNLEDGCLSNGTFAEIRSIQEERDELAMKYNGNMKFGQDAPVKKKEYDDFTSDEHYRIYSDSLYSGKNEVAEKYHTTLNVVEKIYFEYSNGELPFN